jgi:NAD-dependent deacetylase
MKHLVVLTGAGISAESGLKTFRDSDGLWEGHNVYDVASPIGWTNNPQLILDFYNMRRMDVAKANPNTAHYCLKKLEEKYAVTIITQNIDDLHERAGSKNVLHLHGEITKCRSITNVAKTFPYSKDIKLGDLAHDGGQLRPHIVWFGEAVPMMDMAISIASTADIFIVIGTSLQVYPAASLIDYVPRDCKKYIIDKNIPNVGINDFFVIEKPASKGMQEMLTLLMD